MQKTSPKLQNAETQMQNAADVGCQVMADNTFGKFWQILAKSHIIIIKLLWHTGCRDVGAAFYGKFTISVERTLGLLPAIHYCTIM